MPLHLSGPTPVRIHENLGEEFYDKVSPAQFPQHIIRYRNDAAAHSIGLGGLNDAAWIAHFGRFEPIAGSFPHPLALRYHGHQFGHYNPELGDGRGFLFAQFHQPSTETHQQPKLLDLGTKGSGQTPYSRTADGRLTLKGAVREILATELLDAYGVATSHTFSVIETGEKLMRNDEPSPTRSAVLVRLLHSHIRIGSFQRLAYLNKLEELKTLTRHVVRYHYAALDPEAEITELAPAFIHALAGRVAEMVAGWMAAGFVHGVLNTDNFNVTGESFDYGPWRFLPYFDPSFTAAYFDHQRRYAFGRQPQAAMWALCRLADCFTEIVQIEKLEESLAQFYPLLEQKLSEKYIYRLGLAQPEKHNPEFSELLLKAAAATQMPFARLFAELYGGEVDFDKADPRWQTHQQLLDLQQACRAMSPRQSAADLQAVKKLTPISMEIEQVEAIWAPIADNDDWSSLDQIITDIRRFKAAFQS